MVSGLLKKIIGSRNDRLLKQYRKTVTQINALEPSLEALTDDQFPVKTQALKERVQGGESLDAILPEAFALVTGS
jgi:preprotein translocase subunit SecA